MPDVAVDASLALKVVFAEQYSAQTTSLFGEWARLGFQPVAPRLVLEELTNSVYKRLRREAISLDQALGALAMLQALDIEVRDVLHAHALSLAYELRLPAAYDGFYLALAQAHDCEFWTADERLYNAVRARLSWVRWVGEYRQTNV